MTKEQILTVDTKETTMTTKTLHEIFDVPVGQLIEMDETEIRNLLTKAELLCRWLRGVLRLKANKKGGK